MGEVQPGKAKMFLVDISYIFSRGEIENVFVQVNKFILLANLLLLDMEEDVDVPIIIGRLFLLAGHTIIDVVTRQLIMRVFN